MNQVTVFIFNLLLALILQCAQSSRQYHVVNQPKTWSDAKTYCESQYKSSLATVITDEDQQNLLSAMAKVGVTFAWTGLNDLAREGNWVWLDGTPCKNNDGECINGDEDTPPQWGSREPNDDHGREDCGVIQVTSVTTNGRTSWWNDARCDYYTVPFACNYPPPSKWSAGALVGGWTLFEGAGKWYECPAGYVIAGFWKNTCQSLYCLEEMYCVAPKVPVASQTCYDMNIVSSFDHAGTVECNAGYFVRGIWSNNNQNWNCGLYCWEHLRCCKYDERQLAVSPTSDTQNWWSCFDGSRSGWCLVDNDEYITGFTRTAGNGQLYQLEEAKARKIFKKASVIGLPDQEAPQFEGPPNDITNPNDGGYYIEISKPTFLAIGGLIASVIVINFIVMCYVKKNKGGNAGYGVVKHIDSDSEYA